MSFVADSWATTALLMLVAALVSAALAGVVMHRAPTRLLDMPGRRRSHSMPTPRGGGVGFAIALVACGLLPGTATTPATSLLLASAVMAVAAVGFWDDHQSQAAAVRVAVHVFAVILVLAALVPTAAVAAGPVMKSLALLGLGLALVWSVNLHNFMDGIDGLLALQAVFVSIVIAMAALFAGMPMLSRLALVGAAAVAAFLPFNFPRARVFMGDVGSGVLGLWLGILAILCIRGSALSLAAVMVVFSAFTLDATLTLAVRIAHRRRWYSAHREHLYQWLARSGLSHARVAGLYMLWNLFIVVPATSAIMRMRPYAGGALAAAVYTAGGLLWCGARMHCLKRVNARRDGDVAA
ncbi:MAG: glycosyl transferase family 4 [Rhodanobacteraceae bacterium]